MGKVRETFGKKDIRSKKEKKRKEKEQKRQERKENKGTGSLDDMIAYVDEFGNITSTPPETQRTTVSVEEIEIGVRKSAEPDPADLIHTGIVTFFDTTKGFGFIRDSSNQQDVFVHVNGLLESIKEGNKVNFEVIRGLKGLNAINVKVNRE